MNRALAIALEMDESEAALILTLADEPLLICETSEELDAWRSALDPDKLAAARIVGDWVAAECPPPVFH